jgi:hypothetical protein
MGMDFKDLAAAFGLMLVIEGLLYALFPGFMRRTIAQMLALPPAQIRSAALVSVALGVFVVWLAVRFLSQETMP